MSTLPALPGESIVMRLLPRARDLPPLARVGLMEEQLEAEFMGDQQAARKLFARLGFDELLVLPGYVKDMQAIPHDYVLMGKVIKTDEEFAGEGRTRVRSAAGHRPSRR